MKLIERQGRLTVDRREIDGLIAAKKFIGLNRTPRPEKVIVSLTSYKPRIDDVKYVIFSLLNQNFPPDKLILWLDEDSFPQREENLPRDLLELKNFGLTIDWCENLRSYKKLIPALERFPDDVIVTADDDLFYRPDWLKILCDEHKKFPDCVIAHYVHRVRLDTSGKFYPFTKWITLVTSRMPVLGHSAGTGGGMLVKRKFFHADVLRRDIFTKLIPLADELWFWAMLVLKGTKTKIPAAAINRLIYIDVDMQLNGETLRSVNVDRGKNDVQLRNVTKKYPALLDALVRETVEFRPHISVVVPIKNSADLPVHLQNLFALKYPDCELIVINCGVRVNLPPLPTNFRLVDYPGGSLADALNLGLRKATGEYVMFKDENSLLANDALNLIAKMTQSRADVIHFAGRVRLADRKIIRDDAFEPVAKTPQFLTASRQRRAALWLQGKFSRRLVTKIFRREFLNAHGLNFGVDPVEFMFGALIDAEKYLLVPQAFSLVKE